MSRLITLTAVALPLAMAAFVAAPVAAEGDHVRVAIEHFNRDVDRQSDRVARPGPETIAVTVSTRNSDHVGRSFQQFDATADRASDISGLSEVTLIGSTPSRDTEIFDAMREEDRGSD